MRISEYLKVGKKLKMARSGAGITQRCMAVKLDLSYSTYSNYENGYSEPSMEVIYKACDALQISVEQLLGLTTAATAPQGSQTSPDKKDSLLLIWCLIFTIPGWLILYLTGKQCYDTSLSLQQ